MNRKPQDVVQTKSEIFRFIPTGKTLKDLIEPTSLPVDEVTPLPFWENCFRFEEGTFVSTGKFKDYVHYKDKHGYSYTCPLDKFVLDYGDIK